MGLGGAVHACTCSGSAHVLHLDDTRHVRAVGEEGVHVLRRDEEELALWLRVAQRHERLDSLLAVRVVHVDVKLVEHAEGRLAKVPPVFG